MTGVAADSSSKRCGGFPERGFGPAHCLSGYSGGMLASFVPPDRDLVSRGLRVRRVGNEFQITAPHPGIRVLN